MERFLNDIRHGFQWLRRSPGASAAAVLALALGIGVNTTIFSIVWTVLLKPLPVKDPDQIVQFSNYNERRKIGSHGCSWVEVVEWRRNMRSFDAIAAHQQGSASLSGAGDNERLLIGKVTSNFFPLLGVQPVLGRGFFEEEDRPDTGRVALLTHEVWKRRFGASAAAIGASILLDGTPYYIVGVLPEGFRFLGTKLDLYTPLALPEAQGARPVGVNAFGRLRKGIVKAQLEAELDAASAAALARNPQFKGWKIRVVELQEWIVPDVKIGLWVLVGAVGMVLLIACANVANLLLARVAARRREMAVRAALGAGRRRLLGQLLTESLPLALLGGALGLLLAWWAIELLPLIETARIPRLAETRLDGLMLAFTGGVSVLTCVVFGLAPALAQSKVDVHEALKESGRTTGGRSSRLRGVLVVAEIAISVVLAVGAVLMIRTFGSLTAVHPGFNPENLLTASIELPRVRYNRPEPVMAFHRELTEKLRHTPGVSAVSATNSLPLGGNYFRSDFRVEGRDYPNPGDIPALDYRGVDREYLKTMQIRLMRGRFFDDADRVDSLPVVVISEGTARRLFGSADPLGRRIGFPGQWMTVVGITADVRHADVSTVTDNEVLIPIEQKPVASLSVILRLDPRVFPDPSRAVPLVRATVTSIDRNLALARAMSMERIMADRLAPRRFNMIVLAMFAALSLTLAAVGIYGVISYTVEQRTREFGVRIALGALSSDVLRMVWKESMMLTAAGLAAGLAGAAALTRFLAGVLYGVRPTDALSFSGSAGLLALVALAAAYVPARRAATLDPVTALRYE